MRKRLIKKSRLTRKRELEVTPIEIPPVMDPPVGGEIVTLDCSGDRIRRMYGLPPLDEEPEQ